MLRRDSGHIQEADAQYVNKKRNLRGEPPIEPLYTLADATEAALSTSTQCLMDRPSSRSKE